MTSESYYFLSDGPFFLIRRTITFLRERDAKKELLKV
jgi:hypothetical protein